MTSVQRFNVRRLLERLLVAQEDVAAYARAAADAKARRDAVCRDAYDALRDAGMDSVDVVRLSSGWVRVVLEPDPDVQPLLTLRPSEGTDLTAG